MTRYSKPKNDDYTESDSDDDQPPPAKPRTMTRYSKPKYDGYTESGDDQPPPAEPQFSDFAMMSRPSKVSERKHDGVNPDGAGAASDGGSKDGAGVFSESEHSEFERGLKLMAVKKKKKNVESLHRSITAMIRNSTPEDLHAQTIRESISKLKEAADLLDYSIKYLQHFDKTTSRASTEFYRFSQPGKVVKPLVATGGGEDPDAFTFSQPGKVLDEDTELAIQKLQFRINVCEEESLHHEIETFELAKETLYEANRLMTMADSLVTKRVAY